MAETSVVLRRTRGREALVALFSAVATYGCGLMLAQRWPDGLAQSLGGGQTLVWALRGVLAIFLVEFLTDALAAVWRLVDGRPFIEDRGPAGRAGWVSENAARLSDKNLLKIGNPGGCGLARRSKSA